MYRRLYDMLYIMPVYLVKPLLAQLAKARKLMGLSQVAVCQHLGLPQSHLSSIENGKHDVRLSTFIELARFLELELVLVPRQLTPAVKQLLQEYSGVVDEDDRAFIPTGDE
jgi:HTH-type transcriptional regulator / antitoxin HipB